MYLSVHQEVPHQRHRLLQILLLQGREDGLLLYLWGFGCSHHEVCNLVIQAVQRLYSWRRRNKQR